MRIPLSWLREYAAIPADIAIETIDEALVACGLEVEEIFDLRDNVSGPLVVGRVESIEELTEFKKPIRYCRIDVGESETRGIICGARNFASGDLVVVSLPGAVLPGGFEISARKTYGRISDGMIASARELGVGDDHSGIIVLPADTSLAPGADARAAVGLDEVVFELAITPDMSHCFSLRGVAREIAHRLGVAFTDPAHAVSEPKATSDAPYPITVTDTVGCDRFATRVVRGIDPDTQSPEWMQRRLVHAGMRPISAAVDITNYLMLELGQPLHAFDLATLKGGLVVRRAHAGEKLTTLDDVQRDLDGDDMVICDDTGAISLAGVMGGQTSEVSASSVDILFEGAHWDPAMIAATSRRHRLSSEAAKRFERGVDPELAAVAVEKAAQLLVESASGVIDESFGDIDNRRPTKPLTMDPRLPERIVGVDYPDEQVIGLLTAAGCTVVPREGSLTVTPASWRPDITDQADLVEEVVRLDGYGKVPSALPPSPAGLGLTVRQRQRRNIGRAMAAAGCVESVNYPFVDPHIWDVLGLADDDPRRETMRLANPLNDAQPALRTSLLPGILSALKVNVDRGLRDVGLFETGLVFIPRAGWESVRLPSLPVDRRPSDDELAAADALRPEQPQHVAAVFAGMIEPAGWWGPGRAADWSDALAAAHTIAAACDVELTVTAAQYAPWHPGRCARLLVDGRTVGHAGELHPAVCDALDIPRRTCAVEMDLDAIPPAPVRPAPAMSRYPVALIDVAVVVDESVPAGVVAAALAEGAGELLETIDLFDVYTGENLGEGRKSLAYKLSCRAPDRTLTAEETVAARDAAVERASIVCGAQLRSVLWTGSAREPSGPNRKR